MCNESHAGTSAQFWHKDPPKNHLRLDGYEVMAALFQQQVRTGPDGSFRQSGGAGGVGDGPCETRSPIASSVSFVGRFHWFVVR